MKPTGFGVALEAQHNLRSTVPSCRDIFSHVTSILLGIDRETTRETKVTNLKFTIRIDQQVTGLQVTVQDVRRMDVLQTAEDLVDERLKMRIGQGLSGTNDSGQITLHQF